MCVYLCFCLFFLLFVPTCVLCCCVLIVWGVFLIPCQQLFSRDVGSTVPTITKNLGDKNFEGWIIFEEDDHEKR